MERVFSEDIFTVANKLRFGRGERRDYPRATWEQIAHSLGRPLKEFTMTPDEVVAGIKNAIPSAQGRPTKKTTRAALKE